MERAYSLQNYNKNAIAAKIVFEEMQRQGQKTAFFE